jgi:hypothetical protein
LLSILKNEQLFQFRMHARSNVLIRWSGVNHCPADPI